MRQDITTLRAKVKYSAEKIERISMNDIQNDELSGLIQSIKNSNHGQQALQSIFQEAEETGSGKGDILKGIWEQDVSDMSQFAGINNKMVC